MICSVDARPSAGCRARVGNRSDMSDSCDVIVLGARSTGTNLAWYARDNGLSVAVFERELIHGQCSYSACMPSKGLLVQLLHRDGPLIDARLDMRPARAS